MRQGIPLDVKRTCIEMANAGTDIETIYHEYFIPNTNSPQSLISFRRSLNKWKSSWHADSLTLDAGTYEGFVAHDATVQVSSKGEVIQAWIKQKASDMDPNEFVKLIVGKVESGRVCQC